MAGVEQAKEAKFIQLQEKKAEEKKEVDLQKVEEKAEAKKEEAKEVKAAEKKGEKKTGKPEDKKTAPAKKPEEKKEEKKEEPKKREIVLERIYAVPMADAYAKPQMSRGNFAITLLRRFLVRHMKADEKKVKISLILNNLIRKRGSGRPLKKVKIKATKDKEGVVLAEISA